MMAEEFMPKGECTERHKRVDEKLDSIDDGIQAILKKLDKRRNGIVWKVLAIVLTFTGLNVTATVGIMKLAAK